MACSRISGRRAEGGPGLDLQDQPEILRPHRSQVVLHGVHVALVTQERQRHHVGVRRGHPEQRQVGVGHGVGGKIRLGQVDPLLRPQLGAPCRGRHDPDVDLAGTDPLDDAGQLPVVQHDVLARPRRVEDGRQRAADPRRPRLAVAPRLGRRSVRP